MQMFADICYAGVVLPKDPGGAVVLGAAILGRFAAEVKQKGTVRMGEEEQGEALWRIMVYLSCEYSLTFVLMPYVFRWR